MQPNLDPHSHSRGPNGPQPARDFRLGLSRVFSPWAAGRAKPGVQGLTQMGMEAVKSWRDKNEFPIVHQGQTVDDMEAALRRFLGKLRNEQFYPIQLVNTKRKWPSGGQTWAVFDPKESKDGVDGVPKDIPNFLLRWDPRDAGTILLNLLEPEFFLRKPSSIRTGSVWLEFTRDGCQRMAKVTPEAIEDLAHGTAPREAQRPDMSITEAYTAEGLSMGDMERLWRSKDLESGRAQYYVPELEVPKPAVTEPAAITQPAVPQPAAPSYGRGRSPCPRYGRLPPAVSRSTPTAFRSTPAVSHSVPSGQQQGRGPCPACSGSHGHGCFTSSSASHGREGNEAFDERRRY
ncbi:hypothetical protein C8A00DRAFT_32329 [Chaetomidium leptoderma]|uniref:Uncharacterized protein n=1 Tax=Chaetomidium leptoderma TaxID=669021 RepID=A0AAN6ZYJ6_9PEZI|nr:hypothetical protein C8A00DRAFT_32329 [Chaetomidium leptoderma]